MQDDNITRRVSRNLIMGTSSATRGAFYKDMNLQKSLDPNINRASIVIALKRTSWFERLWYPIFLLAGVFCLIFIRPFNFELCFSVLSLWLYMFANNLIARGKLTGIIISIISASLYTVVSFFAKVYGEVLINILLYIPLDIIALITFKKNKDKNTNEVSIKKLNIKGWLLTIFLTVVGAGIIFVILYFLPGQVYPLLNALSIAFFLTALIIRNLRFKEFWWFNMLGNIVTITLWVIVSMAGTDMLYGLPVALSSLAALCNNVYGIIMWQSIYRKEKTHGGIYVKRVVKINKVIKLRRRYNKAMNWNKEVEENRKISKISTEQSSTNSSNQNEES